MITRRPALLNAGRPDGLHAGGFVFEVALASVAAGGEPDLPREIQVTPRGSVTARDGRSFIFDPEALVARFQAEGLKLPIDFEHESDFVALLGARPARGWIVDLIARPEGTFGVVEWLEDGAAALRARHYRYISPAVWLERDGRTGRRIKGASLVAAPAVAMPALAAMQSRAHPSTKDITMEKELLALLGLAEGATLDQAKTAVARLSAVDPTQYVPLAQLSAAQSELAQLKAEKVAREAADLEARAVTLVDDAVAAGKVAPAAREHYLTLARMSLDQTRAALDAMPAVLSAGEVARLKRAAGTDAGAITEDERQIAARLGLSDEQFLKARG